MFNHSSLTTWKSPNVSVVLMVGVATVLIPPMKIEDDAATGGPLEPGFSWHGQKKNLLSGDWTRGNPSKSVMNLVEKV